MKHDNKTFDDNSSSSLKTSTVNSNSMELLKKR